MRPLLPERKSASTAAGPRLRCFLSAALLLPLLIGSNGTKEAYAAPCPAPPDMKLSRVQGTVDGPSGVPVPQILVWVERDGKSIAKTQTDSSGKFEIKVAPGKAIVHVQYLAYKQMDINVRLGHGGLFHSPRLLIVLGLSGTRCSFVTTSKKEFKNAIKRYQKQLEEVRNSS